MKRIIKKSIIVFLLLIAYVLFVPVIATNSTIVINASTVDDKKPDIRLNLKTKSIVKDKSFALKVYNTPDKTRISYKSSDSEVASVDNLGLITANKVGDAVITATVKTGGNTLTLTCDITVGPPAVSIVSNKSRIILSLDQSDVLKVIIKPSNTAEEAKFSSNNSSIASISSGGRITGKSLGHTYVFAEIGDTADNSRKYATCAILVVNSSDLEHYVKYFTETKELERIPESHLNKALDNYFNSDGNKSPASLNIYLKSLFDFQVLGSQEIITSNNLYKIDL